MRKMTVSSRTNKNDLVFKGSIRRPARSKSPPATMADVQQDIGNRIGDFDDSVQVALRSLSSTIETIREISDGGASTSIVYEDIDDDVAGTIGSRMDEDVEVERYDDLSLDDW